MTQHAAVLGHPIAHSLSPAIHRAAYAYLGLDWTYEAIDVTVEQLDQVLLAKPDWVGWSLTMPLKERAAALVDVLADDAEAVRAVNTVVVRENRCYGYNTDISGLVAVLTQVGLPPVTRAAVIGAGATARSSLAALARVGCHEVAVFARREAGAADLAQLAQRLSLSPAVRPWSEVGTVVDWPVVVSTVPVAASAELAAAVGAVARQSPALGTLLDVGYVPWPTPVAKLWHEMGGDIVSGLELLVAQAGAQVELMTGRSVPTQVLRDAVSHPAQS